MPHGLDQLAAGGVASRAWPAPDRDRREPDSSMKIIAVRNSSIGDRRQQSFHRAIVQHLHRLVLEECRASQSPAMFDTNAITNIASAGKIDDPRRTEQDVRQGPWRPSLPSSGAGSGEPRPRKDKLATSSTSDADVLAGGDHRRADVAPGRRWRITRSAECSSPPSRGRLDMFGRLFSALTSPLTIRA